MKAAIFDMDGTLVDSMTYWRKVNFDILCDNQIPIPEDLAEDLPVMSAYTAAKIYAQRYPQLGMDTAQMIQEYYRRMRFYYAHEVKAKPGALDYLKQLNQQGIPCCVATATTMEIAEPLLERLGFMPYLQFATCTDDEITDKHDPQFFQIMAERLNVPVQDCAMFEDALYAARSAKTAGCQVIVVDDPTAVRNRNELKALCNRYIMDFRELLD